MKDHEQAKQLEEWMLASQAGDAQAYRKLLAAITVRLRPFLLSKLTPDKAEDVLQEILVSIHKARHTYDSVRPLMPWVMAIARFRLSDHFRSHYRRDKEISDDGAWLENIASDENVTETIANRELFQKLLPQLSPKQRQVLQLLYFEGLSVKEAAIKLKMGESAVKVNAHRGYKRLRELMEVAS